MHQGIYVGIRIHSVHGLAVVVAITHQHHGTACGTGSLGVKPAQALMVGDSSNDAQGFTGFE